MELRSLRAFVEVVRQGGFTSAAKIIYATQPTISKSVRQLEEELGLRLLDRTKTGVQLTEAGHLVYKRALNILGEREDLLLELDELRGLKRGLLRLGIPPFGGSTLFAPIFSAFHDRFPHVEIQLAEHGSRRLCELVLAGDLDFGASLLPVSNDFETLSLQDEPLVALLPASHPRAQADSIRLIDLASDRFVLFEDGFALNDMILAACQRNSFVPSEVTRSGQLDFIVELVASRLGVAFLPLTLANRRPHPQIRQLILDEPHTNWNMAMVWRRNSYISYAGHAWLELTRKIYPTCINGPIAPITRAEPPAGQAAAAESLN